MASTAIGTAPALKIRDEKSKVVHRQLAGVPPAIAWRPDEAASA